MFYTSANVATQRTAESVAEQQRVRERAIKRKRACDRVSMEEKEIGEGEEGNVPAKRKLNETEHKM